MKKIISVEPLGLTSEFNVDLSAPTVLSVTYPESEPQDRTLIPGLSPVDGELLTWARFYTSENGHIGATFLEIVKVSANLEESQSKHVCRIFLIAGLSRISSRNSQVLPDQNHQQQRSRWIWT